MDFPGKPKNVDTDRWEKILVQVDSILEAVSNKDLHCVEKLTAMGVAVSVVMSHVAEHHGKELESVLKEEPQKAVFKAFVRDLAKFLEAIEVSSPEEPEPAKPIPVLVNKTSTTVFH
jgi:hypothetical protein